MDRLEKLKIDEYFTVDDYEGPVVVSFTFESTKKILERQNFEFVIDGRDDYDVCKAVEALMVLLGYDRIIVEATRIERARR